jgi:hypothetical protein
MAQQQFSDSSNLPMQAMRKLGGWWDSKARQSRDVQQQQNITQSMTLLAAQHASVMEQEQARAKLESRAAKGRAKRIGEFHTSVHGLAHPGTRVDVQGEGYRASYTKFDPNAPKPKTEQGPKPPKPSGPGRRVPIKKNRGGKKIP